MTREWFRPWGWIYRPVSWQAVVVLAMAGIFCVQVFVAIDRRSHSVSDTLYGIFPFVVPCLMLVNWLASKTSRAGLDGGRSVSGPMEGRPT